MTATIIDGKARAERLRKESSAGAASFLARHGLQPTLAAVLVGDDPASALYVRRKVEQTQETGLRSLSFKLPSDVEESELLALIARLNADDAVHGILVQLPLPPHVDRAAVLAAIDPDKDVDGFHAINVGRLALAQAGLVPCTPTGCMMLLADVAGDLTGRHAVVVGTSAIVGHPMAELLLQARCTVTLAHIHTVDLPDVVTRADILVAAAGAPGLIRGAWLKPGAIVIDVGINRVIGENGKARIVGDVRFDEALPRAAAITPVPGGVGPMTIACLIRNTLLAAERLTERRDAHDHRLSQPLYAAAR